MRCDAPLGELLYLLPLATVEHPLLAKGVIIDDAINALSCVPSTGV